MSKMIRFGPPKKKSIEYLMADYVELLCIASLDNQISVDDAVKEVYHSAEAETQLEVEIEEDVVEEEPSYQIKDNQKGAGEDWFRQLEYRYGAFKNYYPFQIHDGILTYDPVMSQEKNLYIYLLICSNLRIIKRDVWPCITHTFEMLSADIMAEYLPGFTVHHFGKTIKGKGSYPAKLKEALVKLSTNIREKLICDLTAIGEINTGDGGLDVIAWRHPYEDDNASGCLICFAQCACGHDDWSDKQLESHPVRWRAFFDFIHSPANFVFIPFCFRNSTGSWYDRYKLHDSILMDRLRMCHLSNKTEIGRELSEAATKFIEYVKRIDN